VAESVRFHHFSLYKEANQKKGSWVPAALLLFAAGYNEGIALVPCSSKTPNLMSLPESKRRRVPMLTQAQQESSQQVPWIDKTPIDDAMAVDPASVFDEESDGTPSTLEVGISDEYVDPLTIVLPENSLDYLSPLMASSDAARKGYKVLAKWLATNSLPLASVLIVTPFFSFLLCGNSLEEDWPNEYEEMKPHVFSESVWIETMVIPELDRTSRFELRALGAIFMHALVRGVNPDDLGYWVSQDTLSQDMASRLIQQIKALASQPHFQLIPIAQQSGVTTEEFPGHALPRELHGVILSYMTGAQQRKSMRLVSKHYAERIQLPEIVLSINDILNMPSVYMAYLLSMTDNLRLRPEDTPMAAPFLLAAQQRPLESSIKRNQEAWQSYMRDVLDNYTPTQVQIRAAQGLAVDDAVSPTSVVQMMGFPAREKALPKLGHILLQNETISTLRVEHLSGFTHAFPLSLGWFTEWIKNTNKLKELHWEDDTLLSDQYGKRAPSWANAIIANTSLERIYLVPNSNDGTSNEWFQALASRGAANLTHLELPWTHVHREVGNRLQFASKIFITNLKTLQHLHIDWPCLDTLVSALESVVLPGEIPALKSLRVSGYTYVQNDQIRPFQEGSPFIRALQQGGALHPLQKLELVIHAHTGGNQWDHDDIVTLLRSVSRLERLQEFVLDSNLIQSGIEIDRERVPMKEMPIQMSFLKISLNFTYKYSREDSHYDLAEEVKIIRDRALVEKKPTVRVLDITSAFVHSYVEYPSSMYDEINQMRVDMLNQGIPLILVFEIPHFSPEDMPMLIEMQEMNAKMRPLLESDAHFDIPIQKWWFPPPISTEHRMYIE
jgi:hypothetical protein